MWQALSALSAPTPNGVQDAAVGEAALPALAVPIEKLSTSLSFSHLTKRIAIADPLKRAFDEIECIRGIWVMAFAWRRSKKAF